MSILKSWYIYIPNFKCLIYATYSQNLTMQLLKFIFFKSIMLYVQLEFYTIDLGVLVLFIVNINYFMGLCVGHNEQNQFLLVCC
jgi:hypothetical protein